MLSNLRIINPRFDPEAYIALRKVRAEMRFSPVLRSQVSFITDVIAIVAIENESEFIRNRLLHMQHMLWFKQSS